MTFTYFLAKSFKNSHYNSTTNDLKIKPVQHSAIYQECLMFVKIHKLFSDSLI